MSISIENYFPIEADREIFYQTWPCEKPKAVIFLTHGIGEHSGGYDNFANALAKNKIKVFAWDLRGHGRSSGQRGYVSNFKEHCTDFKKIFKFFKNKEEYSSLPIFLFGHSMGGAVVLRSYIEQKPKTIHGLCLSSPALGIKQKPSPAKESLAQFANKYLPRLTLSNDVIYENLSQIPEQLEFYRTDSLRHNKINARTYSGMLESFDIIFNKSSKIKLPILFQVSENDKIVDAEKTQELHKLIESETNKLILYSNSEHEVFNDIEQEQAIKDLTLFINQTLKGKS